MRRTPPENMPHEHLLMYADGAVQPDITGVGLVVVDKWQQVVYVANKTLPPMTNNEAEYMGLLLALETGLQMQAQFLEIRLDSEIVVYQMIGRFSVNSPALKRLHTQACTLARGFTRVIYTQIAREYNELADALATEAAAGRYWHSPDVKREA